MQKKWEDIVKDPEERKVFSALDNPRWDFRTIEALKREIGLPSSKIEKIIHKYKDLIRQSPVPDKKGRRLYTLTERGQRFGEIFNIIRQSVTKTSSGTSFE